LSFDLAQKVADAVLYEGYVLYPYRASAAKNRVRWQFGVVVPRVYAEQGGSEPWAMQTEVLVEPEAENVEIDLRVRFLQVQARTVEEAVEDSFRPVETLDVDDRTLVTWEEGVEQRLDASSIPLAELVAGERSIPLAVPGGRETETVHTADGRLAGRIGRERWPLSAVVRLTAERVGSRIRVRTRIENLVEMEPDVDREKALRRSLIGAHTLLAVRGGAFVSLLDPPADAAAEAAQCSNQHTWPVLIGEAPARNVLLSSPIILYDYPAVAPESLGDLCDATEIDEILTLRVMTLTDEEKREARGTDERARQIIERSDSIPPEIFERMHGAVRSLAPHPLAPSPIPSLPPGEGGKSEKRNQPNGDFGGGGSPLPVGWEGMGEGLGVRGALADWESFLNPPGVVAPEDASLEIGGVRVAQGSRVILRPSRRADSMDLFLSGRVAQVQGIYRDLEDEAYVAVSLVDDPASEMHTWHGRFLYFYPEEVEPWEGESNATDRAVGVGGAGDHDRNDESAGSDPLREDQPDVSASPRTLIAGIGNIFLGDDGFGPEVVRRLAAKEIPDGVRIVDFGIRGIHLAYELAEKTYDSTILVDATPRGGEPGTVYLIEPDLKELETASLADAHEMNPRAVLGYLRTLGGTPGKVLVVGCEPSPTDEEMGEIGLSAPVAAAVDEAVALILDVLSSSAHFKEMRDVPCDSR
jgi:hydrogenase maturation protease